jgi:predicted ATPase/DNA-binding winged helix-turn-helix (wHTH) protein
MAIAPWSIARFGPFTLDRQRRLLASGQTRVRLGARALDILIALVSRAGEVVSRHDLVTIVWGDVAVEEAGARVHIATLRKALADGQDGARYIINVSGRGYSFVATVLFDDGAVTAELPPPDQAAHPRQLPQPPRPMIGREEAVEAVAEALLARRLVSIVGSGGIGKTSVALAVAERLRATFDATHTAFVDLGAISKPEQVSGAIIAAVGVATAGSDPLAELIAYLSPRRVLIVIDSCEHVVDAVAVLADRIIHGASEVHLLVTSREPLRIDRETVHILRPLAFPEEATPTAATALQTSAVQLFMERAAFAGYDGHLSDSDAPIVSDICRRVDGLALAIELVASRVGTYGIKGLSELLDSNLELQLPGRRTAPSRHRTLESMLDWSFLLLSEPEKQVLTRLSVFVGPFTMPAAAAVARDPGEIDMPVTAIVAGLVDKSLVWVQQIRDTFYYRLPDTTRGYAANRLAEREGATATERRHAVYFADKMVLKALWHRPSVDFQAEAPHLGNIRKALNWGFAAEDRYATGRRLAVAAAPLMLGLWLFAECRQWAMTALRGLDDASGGSTDEARLQEALALSSMHTRGNTGEVRDALERALTLPVADTTEMPQLRLLAGLEIFLTRLGDFEGALTTAKRFSTVADTIGTERERILAQWMLATTFQFSPDHASAAAHYDRGFQLAAGHDDLDGDLFGYNHKLRATIGRSLVLWHRGSPMTARTFAQQAIEEGRQKAHPTNYCMAVVYSVPVLLWSGDSHSWQEDIDRVLDLSERYAMRSYAGVAMALRGEALIANGDALSGIAHLRRAITVLTQERHGIVTPAARRALADGLAAAGLIDEALATIDAAISSARELGQQYWLPDLVLSRAAILKNVSAPRGEYVHALVTSMEMSRAQGSLGRELRAALALARVLAAEGRSTEAAELLHPVMRSFRERVGTEDLAEASRMLAAASIDIGVPA